MGVRRISVRGSVVKLGVSEHKPKPTQAQAIKARPAEFKLRFAGQADRKSLIQFWGAQTLRQTELLMALAFTKPGSDGTTVHEMGWRSRQLMAGPGQRDSNGYASHLEFQGAIHNIFAVVFVLWILVMVSRPFIMKTCREKCHGIVARLPEACP
ncbi:hypothetical protein B0H14DRAFT_2637636 [Mycena olivaceomarginata]|nr:hypothetical protein B0H14DRAFT_2637636 [Mycena olivaceomarginata]